MSPRIAQVALAVGLLALARGQSGPRSAANCAPDNGGITLPKGLCATVFADSLAGPRHLVVAPNGDVFVALQGGGVIVLRDRNADGVADERNKFGDFHATEVALFDGYLYTENGSDILRFRLPTGSMAPTGEAEEVVTGLPKGGHGAKTFTISRDGSLYVNVGSATNSCQTSDRRPEVPGADPCTELETRAGIWRFDAKAASDSGNRPALRARHPQFGLDHDQSSRRWALRHAAWPRPARWRRSELAEAL